MSFKLEKITKLRKYKHLPVTVVEDHNEVIPYIHRAIASRHLPVENLTLVHFDSHPDMLIPLELDADTVFNKELLYESTSIENWILPAVYAGHINHVVWLKPPWCEQFKDKTITFYVGQCKKTGYIRTTCKENYFVSETLYVPEHQLRNKKILTYTIKTVIPVDWQVGGNNLVSKDVQQTHPLPESSLHCESTSSKCGTNTQLQSKLDNLEEEFGARENCAAEECRYSCNDKLRVESDFQDFKSENHSSKRPCQQSNTEEITLKSENKRPCHQSNTEEITLKSENKRPCQQSNKEEITLKKQKIHLNEGGIHSTENQSVGTDCKKAVDPFKSISDHVTDDAEACTSSNTATPTAEKFKNFMESLEGKHFILDIDLDFFSTKNPFKEMYSQKQYMTLKDLYHFNKPDGDLDEDIELCVQKRHKQLVSLKEVFNLLMKDKDAIFDHPRKDDILTLVKDLTCEGMKTADFDLLHEAGCTCDDTELPHYVSTESEILKLVDATQELLSHLPKPAIITIARSSNDDYCPKNQVDFIQNMVLESLQDLYLEISVTIDYDEPSVQ
ncbi:hypothetical protein ACJMK2_010881 [Sinanodonta woodiana]|uniref:CE022 protein n=1 Tax=Sinanodonta woodiana TaxID=1069815 RepID=A0ABD3VK01_SINWO